MSKGILPTAGYPGELALSIITNWQQIGSDHVMQAVSLHRRKLTVCVTGLKVPEESLILEIMTEVIIILNTVVRIVIFLGKVSQPSLSTQ